MNCRIQSYCGRGVRTRGNVSPLPVRRETGRVRVHKRPGQMASILHSAEPSPLPVPGLIGSGSVDEDVAHDGGGGFGGVAVDSVYLLADDSCAEVLGADEGGDAADFL